MEAKLIAPPFRPPDDFIWQNFDPIFTQESAELTPIDKYILYVLILCRFNIDENCIALFVLCLTGDFDVYVFQLEQKQIPPPYRPRLESERDLANFPPEFTDEPVQLTPDDQYCIFVLLSNLVSKGSLYATFFSGASLPRSIRPSSTDSNMSIPCSCQPKTKCEKHCIFYYQTVTFENELTTWTKPGFFLYTNLLATNFTLLC